MIISDNNGSMVNFDDYWKLNNHSGKFTSTVYLRTELLGTTASWGQTKQIDVDEEKADGGYGCIGVQLLHHCALEAQMESNPFSRSSRSNTITNSFNDNHKNDNDNDYNPCCRSSRPSTMGKPVGLTPTWGKPSGMKSVDNIRTRKHLAKFILSDPGITFFIRSNPYFSACEQFCRDWDMTSFDPKYPNMQLDE